MAGDPAELAYGHALAMLGDPEAAADVAATALRRAGRARGLVLAHARQQAIARAAVDEPVDIAGLQLVVLDLPALAATLASTRPPEERAALDVRARTAGDLAALGEALGMRASAAADKCNDIADSWERTLDPALLGFSGAGDCEELAAILSAGNAETVADLVAVAPSVHVHAQDCTICSDRIRAMATVRSFFSAARPDVPDEVREVGHASRRRRPSALPAPLFDVEQPRARRRFSTPARIAVATLVVVLAGAGAAVALRDDGNSDVDELTALPANNALQLGAPEVTDNIARIQLRNPSDRAISYQAAMSAEWADVSPRSGRIPARGAVLVIVHALDTAPEGDVRSSLTITTSAGGAMTHEIAWTLERAPDLDATAQGCAVDVHVVEEGDLASFVLHWHDGVEHSVDITNGADGYQAQLTPEGRPITFWVTAVDARGNQSRTADQVIEPGAC